MRTRVKICCISSVVEALLAIAGGADVLGLVTHMPSGPGVIDEETVAEVAAFCPPGVATFLLTSQVDADAIEQQHARCGTTAVQLCNRLLADELRRLRRHTRSRPLKLVPVVHVEGPEAVEEARALNAEADALLLDSGRPFAATQELGGTGRTHDWAISAAVVEAVAPLPVFLAGGLTGANVAGAIARVRPYGLDLCSGVRHEDRLDPTRLRAFMNSVLEADQSLREAS